MLHRRFWPHILQSASLSWASPQAGEVCCARLCRSQRSTCNLSGLAGCVLRSPATRRPRISWDCSLACAWCAASSATTTTGPLRCFCHAGRRSTSWTGCRRMPSGRRESALLSWPLRSTAAATKCIVEKFPGKKTPGAAGIVSWQVSEQLCHLGLVFIQSGLLLWQPESTQRERFSSFVRSSTCALEMFH